MHLQYPEWLLTIISSPIADILLAPKAACMRPDRQPDIVTKKTAIQRNSATHLRQ